MVKTHKNQAVLGVKRCSSGVCSVVVNHRGGGGNLVTVTTLTSVLQHGESIMVRCSHFTGQHLHSPHAAASVVYFPALCCCPGMKDIEQAAAVPGSSCHTDHRLSSTVAITQLCFMTVFAPERMLACITSKLAGLPTDRLAIWYSSVITPVLEYCVVVWHHGLRNYQTEASEAIQRRAICIIYPVTTSMPYWVALQYAELPSISDKRDRLCRDFFRKSLNPSNCIHHLLPPPRDSEITSRLRRATSYPQPRNCTNHYKSFIHHALLKYQ